MTYTYRRFPIEHSQYIHSTGLAIVQVLGGPDGFLWADNRSLVVRAPKRSEPAASAGELRQHFAGFCANPDALQKAWDEIRVTLTGPDGDDGDQLSSFNGYHLT